MQIAFMISLLSLRVALFLLIFSRVLPKLPNPLRFNVFLAYSGFIIIVCAFYSVFALCIFTLVGRHDLAQHTTSKLWRYMIAPVVGIKLDIEDEDRLPAWGGDSPKGPCVFVVNHQSELDAVLAAREGVRSYSTKAELLPFKRGAVAIAMDAGNFPLVPVVVANCAHVFHVPGRYFSSGTIRVKVLEPISTNPRDGETKEEAMLRILEEVREKTLETMKLISGT